MISLRTLFGVALACAAPLFAQPDVSLAAPPEDQLETLVSPIALYPDPLVSIILPAATVPGDVALAARFTNANTDPNALEAQTWDESVKSLAHYPELLTWMDQNLEWTKQLGATFVTQPADVMNTIQRLRQRAREAGILVDTPEQRVVVEQNYVYIEPAQPDVIYVPSYDPGIFYSSAYGYSRPRSGLSFSVAFSTGPWLAFEPDWSRRSIWIDRRRDWQRRDWRPAPTNVVVNAERQAWRPRRDAVSRAATVNNSITINNRVNNTTRIEVARPTPFAAAASAPTTSATVVQDRERSRNRAGAPPTPHLPPAAREPPPPPPSREPMLSPTGRMTPRAMPSPRAEAVAPPSEAISPPTRAVAPPTEAVPTPPPARDARDARGPDLREGRGPRVPTSAPHVPATLPPTPKGSPPTPTATPPASHANAPTPPPNAKSDQPPPKGKAKGKERDDDDEAPPPRGK